MQTAATESMGLSTGNGSSTKRQHRGAAYKKVCDQRKRPIRGLWQRNGRYYAQMTVEDANTCLKRVRRVPPGKCENGRPGGVQVPGTADAAAQRCAAGVEAHTEICRLRGAILQILRVGSGRQARKHPLHGTHCGEPLDCAGGGIFPRLRGRSCTARNSRAHKCWDCLGLF